MFTVLTESIFTPSKLKNTPDHSGNRTYDLWNARPMLCQLSYAVKVCDISKLSSLNAMKSIYYYIGPWILHDTGHDLQY